MPDFKTYELAATALAAVLAGLLGIFKYFNYRTRRDRIALVRDAFTKVVASLAADSEVDRLAGAILLRRFFDPNSEVSIPDTVWMRLARLFGAGSGAASSATPYAAEAVGVIASILRGQPTGNFQKLLADGLAYAPTLRRADLQRTNLQTAYLGARTEGPSDAPRSVTVDLSHADFYRADLSGASLKGAMARGAVFYQARLRDTVLRGADLRDANFYEADLGGANFDGAILTGASFNGARNILSALTEKLDGDGRYPHVEPFRTPPRAGPVAMLRVFVSKPGLLRTDQQQVLAALCRRLTAEGLQPELLERSDYPKFSAFAEVQRRMESCAGAVLLGFRELEVSEGRWRAGTAEERRLYGVHLTTPWSHAEAGLAIARRLPLLVVAEPGVSGGVFDLAGTEHGIWRLPAAWNDSAAAFTEWCTAVRERAAKG